MALKNVVSDVFNISEFQTSGFPWVIYATTSGTSVNTHSFSRVSKNVTVKNNDASGKNLRIGFTLNGVNGNGGKYYFFLEGGQSMTFDAKITDIFVRADTSNTINYSVYASLTTVLPTAMPFLSGTLQDGSAGWGGVG